MAILDLARRVDEFLGKSTDTVTSSETSIVGLYVHRQTRPNAFESTVYNPVICLNLQGSKEVAIGDKRVISGSGESLFVSHDLPVAARVIEASAERPYLAMIVAVDITLLRSLHEDVGEAALNERQAQALTAGATDTALVDALERYFALTNYPVEAKVMAPLILKEIHFRMLMANHGGMIRQLMQRDSHASRISRAIGRIQTGYRGPLTVTELADEAGMSPSSFHEHFKQITGTTPLQYQKDLRLMEARRLISMDGFSVSSAAFEVGYESPTQFSREYSRKFGSPPRNDVYRPGIAV